MYLLCFYYKLLVVFILIVLLKKLQSLNQKVIVDVNIDFDSWDKITNIVDITRCIVINAVSFLLKDITTDYLLNVSLLLSSNITLLYLNKKFKKKSYPTNVLSFRYCNLPIVTSLVRSDSSVFLGDIAISYDKVLYESKQMKKSFINHFSHLLIHSVLHLFGYNHVLDEEARVMENMEKLLLSSIKFI